jgi:hypothetical protein
MEYPDYYSDKDKETYNNFMNNNIKQLGRNPYDFELFMIKIGCKIEVCRENYGILYELTQEEKEEQKNIFIKHGQPYI